jgi:hypothetical protein
MKTIVASVAVAAFCLATAQAAAPLGKETYKAHKQRIEAEYDAAHARCKPLKDHGRDVCAEQARGNRKVALAELEMQFKPTARNDGKLRMARADAVYAVALEKCKTADGNAREICRKDAKAAHAAAKVDATMHAEAVESDKRADKATRDHVVVDDRQADAQFAAAKERCDMLSLEAREPCLADAKRRFGRI